MRYSLLVGLVAVCLSLLGCGAPSVDDPIDRSQEELKTRIFSSTRTAFEEPIVTTPPSGWYALASAGASHLIVTTSQTNDVFGYGPISYVVRDGQVVRPQGTLLHPTYRSSNLLEYGAISTGRHWLFFLGAELFVLNRDGSLKSRALLPFEARHIAWGRNRALVTGTQKALFLDNRGSVLGNVFNFAPAAVRSEGLAFDGSNFLVEYTTGAGVLAAAISETGSVGAPATVAVQTTTGARRDGHSVQSDGQRFIVGYDDQNVLHYRAATVSASLQVTFGPDQTASGFVPGNSRIVFLGGRYVLTDIYWEYALYVNSDGTQQGSRFFWVPWSNATDYAISATPDGTSAIAVDFLGRVSRLTTTLTATDNPRLQVGLGFKSMGSASATFDGSRFWANWSDTGRDSMRAAKLDAEGSVLAPGVTRLDAHSTTLQPLVSNGSSVLRYIRSSNAAVITHPDETTSTVDLTMLYGTFNRPSFASNGHDFLIADSSTAGTALVQVSPTGAARYIVFTFGVAPSATFDGENYVVSYVVNNDGTALPPLGANEYALGIVRASPDLALGSHKIVTVVKSEYGAPTQTLISGGEQSLLVWTVQLNNRYYVYCSRVSRDLELLDTPGVLLGQSGTARVSVVWDGTKYWVAWPESIWPEAVTWRPVVQLVSPEPVRGSILLQDEPFVVSNEAIGSFSALAARPGGPVLLVATPYSSGAVSHTLLFSRQLRDGQPVLGEGTYREAVQERGLILPKQHASLGEP